MDSKYLDRPPAPPVIDEITACGILHGDHILADYDGPAPEHDILAVADRCTQHGSLATVDWTAVTPRQDGSLTQGCTTWGRGHMVTRLVIPGGAA